MAKTLKAIITENYIFTRTEDGRGFYFEGEFFDFMRERLKVLLDQFDEDEAWHRALIDAVLSDIYLSRRDRRWIAGELERLYFPTKTRGQIKREAKTFALQDLYNYLITEKGLSKAEAIREIKKDMGGHSEQAIKQRLKPSVLAKKAKSKPGTKTSKKLPNASARRRGSLSEIVRTKEPHRWRRNLRNGCASDPSRSATTKPTDPLIAGSGWACFPRPCIAV